MSVEAGPGFFGMAWTGGSAAHVRCSVDQVHEPDVRECDVRTALGNSFAVTGKVVWRRACFRLFHVCQADANSDASWRARAMQLRRFRLFTLPGFGFRTA